MSDNYRLLLLEAARLYEKHEAGRPEPFNIFSVLRKETDEIHLHSRFLHALLNYRLSPDNPRKNLADFLRSVVHIDNFDPDRATVERESDNIDILIRDNSSMQAVVIENKIWARDQSQQLWRYAKKLKCQGYTPHLLYLTLYGHSPSEDSVGDLKYECISYKEDLPPWLKRCQKRAYDEPTLRESVAQYLHLIAKLTGTDYKEAYMTDLKELLLKDDGNLNLVLVHDLNEAMVEARVSLLHKLWQEIACKLKEEIPNLPEVSEEDSDITEETIRYFVTHQTRHKSHGIWCKFGRRASLVVEVEDSNSIHFGVYCSKEESKDEYYKLKEELEEALGQSHSNKWWPWYRYAPDLNLNLKYPTREHLKLLVNEDERQEYVEAVVSDVGEVWKSIKDAGLS